MTWFVLFASVMAMVFYSTKLYVQALGFRRDEETGEIIHSNETAIIVCAFWAFLFVLGYFFGYFKIFVICVLIGWVLLIKDFVINSLVD